MKPLDHQNLQTYLDEILDCDAFELHQAKCVDGVCDFYIPYMLNDAVECYLILTHGRMTGQYDPENKADMTAEIVTTEQGSAVIFRQGIGNVFTIWYETAFCEQKCYRYDQIGHFWVEGEEHWRRLVYIIGTIHDKYSYMGPDFCNEKERALISLMGFAPFRYFSPIHESLDSYYEDSAEGFASMKTLAEEAGDREFLHLMKLYDRMPFRQWMLPAMVRAMQSPKRNNLYQLLFDKVVEAASVYPERVYRDGLHDKIKQTRAEEEEYLHSNGFEGRYPLFHRGHTQILVMEEHPFTILELEYENYEFKIQYMISQVSESKREMLLNAGFFNGKGNRGWIAKELEF